MSLLGLNVAFPLYSALSVYVPIAGRAIEQLPLPFTRIEEQVVRLLLTVTVTGPVGIP